jgi:uncharacterized protein
MEPLVKALEIAVQERMASLEGTAHSFEHVKRVLRIAGLLAEQEKADIEPVKVGALLHDIGWAIGQPHNETGAKLAREILRGLHYPEEKSAKAVRIVLYHPMDFRSKLETLEEKVVWDADKIDLLGALGIARGFHWYGNKPFDLTMKTSFEVYAPIYRMLNTVIAKKIAKKRNEITMTFLSALESELSLADLGIK